MKDRPIMFSAPMVRALLDDTKTQTRRLASSPLAKVQPGDRLWVRENFGINDFRYGGKNPIPKERPRDLEQDHMVYFCTESDPEILNEMPQRPSIHMPRWASRLTLMVTEVRFQRLQDISTRDAIAEGIELRVSDGVYVWRLYEDEGIPPYQRNTDDPRNSYRSLWTHLHGAGSWDENPALVALTFAVHACNIDRMEPTE